MSETLPPGPWTFHIGEDYTEFTDANNNLVFAVTYAMSEQLARLIARGPAMLALLMEWELSGHEKTEMCPVDGKKCVSCRTIDLLRSLVT